MLGNIDGKVQSIECDVFQSGILEKLKRDQEEINMNLENKLSNVKVKPGDADNKWNQSNIKKTLKKDVENKSKKIKKR